MRRQLATANSRDFRSLNAYRGTGRYPCQRVRNSVVVSRRKTYIAFTSVEASHSASVMIDLPAVGRALSCCRIAYTGLD